MSIDLYIRAYLKYMYMYIISKIMSINMCMHLCMDAWVYNHLTFFLEKSIDGNPFDRDLILLSIYHEFEIET